MPRAGLDRAAVRALALAVVDDGGPTGYADLTLAAVAARAGVAVPSLYKHVPGLRALRHDVAAACLDELAQALAHAADAPDGAAAPDAAAALRALAHATRDFALAHPGRYGSVQSGDWARDPAATDVHDAAARAVAVLTTAVGAAGVPAQRQVDAVRAFRAAVHGFVTLELGGGLATPHDVDASFAYLVDLLVTGLVARA